jgi:hypothetical protein
VSKPQAGNRIDENTKGSVATIRELAAILNRTAIVVYTHTLIEEQLQYKLLLGSALLIVVRDAKCVGLESPSPSLS